MTFITPMRITRTAKIKITNTSRFWTLHNCIFVSIDIVYSYLLCWEFAHVNVYKLDTKAFFSIQTC